MATQRYEALVEEIDRIVNSPYPTQLKGLRDILCTRCVGDDIKRWALARPCQVDRLVRCVLEGLRQWSYVLDIVTRLSYSIKLRDALLHQEPTLLPDLVARAVQTGDASSKYTNAAMIILSHPLPGGIILPSNVQTLFIQLFDYAAQQPSVATIRPVYQILQGRSTLLLGLLSSNVLLRFENHLIGIMSNLKGNNASLSLYCLAIIRILAMCSNEQSTEFPATSYDTQELLASTQLTSSTRWKPDTVQQYFKERKAQKTMQLIVLRVMWACTSTTGESLDEKMEALLLANEIIPAVPVHERGTWRKANALVPLKFEEKVFSPLLEPELRFQALCFLVRLSEGGAIPPAVMEGLRQIVVKTDKIVEALRVAPSESAGFLCGAGVFDERTTTTFLLNVVDFAAGAASAEAIETHTTMKQLLRQLCAATTDTDDIVKGAMLALDTLSFGPKLPSLAHLVRSSPAGMNQYAPSSACAQALQNARNGLIHELCAVFLKAALSTAHQSYSISQDLWMLLLDLHAASTQMSPACSHVRPAVVSSHRTISFVEAESTPEETAADWREALRSELTARASSEHERIATIFAKSCEELEARCMNAEQPLQRERAHRLAIQEKYDEIQRAYDTLECTSLDRTIQLKALEQERDQCLTDLEAVRSEHEELARRCTDLEDKLLDVQHNAEKDVSSERRAAEAAAFRHSTTLAKKVEELEDLQTQIQSLERELESREHTSQRVQSSLDKTAADLESTRQEVEQVNQAKQEQQVDLENLRHAKTSLLKEKEQLERDMRSIKADRDNESEAHSVSIRRMEDETCQKLAAAEISRKQELADLTTQHDEALQSMKRKLSEVEDESRQAQARHRTTIEQRDADIAEKEKKLDRLNRRCEQKDKQIREANAMRSKLMAAMGFGSHQTQIDLPHRPSRSSTAQTQYQETGSQEDPSPPTPFSGDDGGDERQVVGQPFTSSISSNESRSGPTPKRARPKRPSKATCAVQPRFGTTTTSRSSRSAIKRQPLLDVGTNMSTKRTAAPKTPLKEAIGDLDEITFDGSDLFAGTPCERMLGLADTVEPSA